jgi:acetoacetyl-CoA synthetase
MSSGAQTAAGFIELPVSQAFRTSSLRKAGVQKGDRVASTDAWIEPTLLLLTGPGSCIKHSIECVVIFLATATIGAIFSSTSLDMGAARIVERYSEITPKILFIDTQVLYAGKKFDLRTKMAEAVRNLQTKTDLRKTVVVQGVVSAEEFLSGEIDQLEYEQTPFDQPLYILYSSGTTGPPNCICHAVGGALLMHKKEYMLHMEIGVDSVYYQYTTTGWMMWNYLVGSMASGAQIVLYDGSPLYPRPDGQIQILHREGVTHWGTSPRFLLALKRSWSSSTSLPQLDSLRLTSSAGLPSVLTYIIGSMMAFRERSHW